MHSPYSAISARADRRFADFSARNKLGYGASLLDRADGFRGPGLRYCLLFGRGRDRDRLGRLAAELHRS